MTLRRARCPCWPTWDLLERLSQVGCRINGLQITAPNGRSIHAPITASPGRPVTVEPR
jgi:hypothetical protein